MAATGRRELPGTAADVAGEDADVAGTSRHVFTGSAEYIR